MSGDLALVEALLFIAILIAIASPMLSMRMMSSRDRALSRWQEEREKRDLDLDVLTRSMFKTMSAQTEELIRFLEMNGSFLRGIKAELEDREQRRLERPGPQTGA